MYFYLKHQVLTGLTALVLASAHAQSTDSKYEVGINAGAFIYQGDLTPSMLGSFKTPALVFGLSGSRRIKPNLALRLELNKGKLKGDDARYTTPEWRTERAFSFSSSVTELIISGVYQPLPNTRLSPYVFAGIGYSFLKVQRNYDLYNAAYFNGESVSEGLNADIDHTPSKGLPIIPVGLGIRYPLGSSRFSLNSEASYRIMSSDYLDGFSQAANPDQKDHYYKYSVGIIYSFGRKNNFGCPVINY